jgi:hypothetical protein
MIEFRDDALQPHDCLVVAFTGLGHALGQIPYEFHRTLTGTDCAALYVRDLARRWYQYGPDDGCSDPQRVAAGIREAKARCGARRLVMLGNSMGGFGALLFSVLVPETDAVLAFAPQTVIIPEIVRTFGDLRWIGIWRELPAFPFGDLAALPPPRADVTLIYDHCQPSERAHVKRLVKVWPGCT